MNARARTKQAMNRILVIEDDAFVGKMLERTLHRNGYEVTTAPDGRVGTRLYRKHSFDAVITDIVMPVMEGLETISVLRKIDPAAKVVAISGGGQQDPQLYLDLAEKLGATYIFQKPVDRNRLLETLRKLLAEPEQRV